jgi:hypothetical protein
VPEHHFAAEILEIRVLYPPVAQRLVREVVHVFEDEQPGHQPCWHRWLSRPDATYRAEALRQKVPTNLRRDPHQRMAKVDDRLQRLAKQAVLAVVARLAHPSPLQRISPSKESRTAQIGNPKTQENRNQHTAFLQNRILAQIKSQQSINDFRILHGRLKWIQPMPIVVDHVVTCGLNLL